MTGRDDSGSTAVELAILTPVLVLLLLFVVVVGRLALAHQEVNAAAADAARAASIASSPGAAAQAATTTAASDLSGAGIVCAPMRTAVDTAAFRPGGVVRVDLWCAASLQGLSLLRLPGDATISAWAVAPVDAYRTVSP